MSFRKMVLVPSEGSTKRIEKDLDKIHKLLNIVLKIAIHKGYDENFKILKNGTPISDSDVVALLNSALTHEQLLIGENEFIRLLYDSKVDPNWIVNQNMRAKLLDYISSSPPPPKQPPQSPTRPLSPPHSPPRQLQSPLRPVAAAVIPISPQSPTRPRSPTPSNSPILYSKTAPPLIKRPPKRKLLNTEEEREDDREIIDQMEIGPSSVKRKDKQPWEYPLPDDEF